MILLVTVNSNNILIFYGMVFLEYLCKVNKNSDNFQFQFFFKYSLFYRTFVHLSFLLCNYGKSIRYL